MGVGWKGEAGSDQFCCSPASQSTGLSLCTAENGTGNENLPRKEALQPQDNPTGGCHSFILLFSSHSISPLCPPPRKSPSPGHAHMPQDLRALETDSDSASRGKKKRWAGWPQLKNSSLLPAHNVSCPPGLETLPGLAQCCQQHKDISVIMIPPLITCSLHWVPLLCHLTSSSHPPRVSQLVAKAVTLELAC